MITDRTCDQCGRLRKQVFLSIAKPDWVGGKRCPPPSRWRKIEVCARCIHEDGARMGHDDAVKEKP